MATAKLYYLDSSKKRGRSKLCDVDLSGAATIPEAVEELHAILSSGELEGSGELLCRALITVEG